MQSKWNKWRKQEQVKSGEVHFLLINASVSETKFCPAIHISIKKWKWPSRTLRCIQELPEHWGKIFYLAQDFTYSTRMIFPELGQGWREGNQKISNQKKKKKPHLFSSLIPPIFPTQQASNLQLNLLNKQISILHGIKRGS